MGAGQGYPKSCRKLIKTTFNAMLNAPKDKLDPRKLDTHLLPEGKTLKMLKEDILKRHEPIAHHFFSSVGVKLQYIDSCVAEKVMLRMIDDKSKYLFEHLDSIVLPVHDSFIVTAGTTKFYEVLEQVMKEVFKEVVGCSVGLKFKEVPKLGPYKQYEVGFLTSKYGSVNNTPMNYSKDLKDCKVKYNKEYSQYIQRSKDWEALNI